VSPFEKLEEPTRFFASTRRVDPLDERSVQNVFGPIPVDNVNLDRVSQFEFLPLSNQDTMMRQELLA
jgi:hypothetical protein